MLKLTITQAGKEALINAEHTGTAATKIVSMGITDVHFDIDHPGVALSSEIKRITAIGGVVTGSSSISVAARDETTDVYTLRGLGLYLEDGTLFAVYSDPLPLYEKAPEPVYMLQFDFVIGDADIDVSDISFGDVLFVNPPATETVEGIARISTEEEADKGERKENVFITPYLLKRALDKKQIPQATETVIGTAQIATAAETRAGTNDETIITPKKLDLALNLRGVPIGSLVILPLNYTPKGCLRANGTVLNKDSYPELFSVFGFSFGGDKVNTFALPDLRGVFLRMLDEGRGVDPGRAVYTYQDDAIRNIYGAIAGALGALSTGYGQNGAIASWASAYSASSGIGGSGTQFDFYASRVVPTAGENRGKNISVIPFIYAYPPRS